MFNYIWENNTLIELIFPLSQIIVYEFHFGMF